MSDFYERRLLNADTINVRHRLSDPLGGIVGTDDVTLELSNHDGAFNGQDLRGTIVDLTRFDREDNESAIELSGIIAEQTIADERATLRVTGYDQDILQTMIPRRTVTASLFPLAHAEQGLGRTVPIVLGTILSPYPVPYVTENTSSDVYDYLIGEGTSYTNVSMYRDTIGDILSLVNSTDYSLNTTSYAGVTVARFPLRQAKFGGGLHNLYATATGLSAEQNFARAIRTIMTNSVWGVSQSVDNTTFSRVESLLASIGSLSCDGVLAESRPAVDVLNQLLTVRGMTLSKTTSSNWTLAIDQGSASATYQATFGHGKGQPWNNVTAFGGLTRTPIQDAVSHLALDYAVEYRTGNYRNTVTRSVLAIGRERRISHDFIQTGVTADKVVDYLSKRLLQGDQKAQFTAGQEARNLNVGDLILYTAPQLGLTEQVFRITELSRRLDTTRLDVEGWASSIYSYTVTGSIPPNVTIPAESLWSVTTPSAPTSLTIIGSGTTTNSQGGYTAFQTLRYNIVNEAFAQTFVRQRTSGNSQWLTVAVDQLTGNNLTTRIDPLITGLPYDYQVDRVNLMDPSLHASTTISSQTAPKDNAAPGTPGTPTISDQHLKTITFVWTAPADNDVAGYYYDIRTGVDGGGSLITSGTVMGGRTITLTLNQIAYGVARTFRVAAIDYSGNGGSSGTFSPSVTFSFTQVVTGDVGDGQITTVKILDANITSAKIGSLAVLTANIQDLNVTTLKIAGTAVTTDKVAANAITASGTYSNDASLTLTTSEQEIGTITVSTDGGIVVVLGKCNIEVGYSNDSVTVYLRKNAITTGTLLDWAVVQNPGSETNNLYVPVTLIGFDASPSGSQVYKLSALRNTQGWAYNRRMVALNGKK